MKVLEIGCGWGTFAAYVARTYGVEVVGVTVSKEQLVYAQKRCEGLPVTFYFGDYRTLPREYDGAFDRVVSIEMVEAVGIQNLDAYMDVARGALVRDGAFLMQAIIGSGEPDPWISTRIFPNGVLPTMVQLARAAEGRFRISRVESFGTDYDKTLMAWDERFRAAWDTIKKSTDNKGKVLYDERFYRMWRYYLMVCAGLFRSQKITVSQLLLTKEGVRSTRSSL
jgi:cyclopropane-fatty-acyl-phospholipid synthase